VKRFDVKLGDRLTAITAELFRQDKEYVGFYIKGEVVALVRLGPGDSVVEATGKVLDAKATQTPTL
jgi:hypothetical protein